MSYADAKILFSNSEYTKCNFNIKNHFPKIKYKVVVSPSGRFSSSIWKAKSMVLMKLEVLYLNTKIKDRMSHDFTFTTQKSRFSEISFRFLCQNAVSEYKHPVLKCSLVLYEDRKYLKCNPNFTSEISVDKLRVLPTIFR